jgi:FtsH-binding integral membrane protein
MDVKIRRTVLALLGGAVVLAVAAWYDTAVGSTLQQGQSGAFDPNRPDISVPLGLGYVALAAGVVIVALLARWANSRSVDLAYAVVGAGCAVLGVILWGGAVYVSGAPPVDALAVLGVALCFVGLSDLGMRQRRASGTPTSPPIRSS